MKSTSSTFVCSIFVFAFFTAVLMLTRSSAIGIPHGTPGQCNFTVKAESKTEKHFKLTIYVPHLNVDRKETEFNAIGQKQNIQIWGADCMSKETSFTTFQFSESDLDEVGSWTIVKEIKPKLEGYGFMELRVDDTLKPMIGGKMGVTCGYTSECNARG